MSCFVIQRSTGYNVQSHVPSYSTSNLCFREVKKEVKGTNLHCFVTYLFTYTAYRQCVDCSVSLCAGGRSRAVCKYVPYVREVATARSVRQRRCTYRHVMYYYVRAASIRVPCGLRGRGEARRPSETLLFLFTLNLKSYTNKCITQLLSSLEILKCYLFISYKRSKYNKKYCVFYIYLILI